MVRFASKTPADFQAESDLYTIMEACKIQKDPKRMKAVRAMAKKQKEEKLDQLTEMNEIAEGKKE